MREIVSIRFGSHLYGTSTPASDLDTKSIHVPAARDILLGRAKRSISTKRPKTAGEKNFAGEANDESYSLQKFMALVAEGQTVALDVLFAPPGSFLSPPVPEWQEITANRHRLITRKSASFVGYCRQQANKYGIKGSRVAAARAALRMLDATVETFGTGAKLKEASDSCERLAADNEHVEIVPIEQAGGTVIAHLDVCGRKLSYNATMKHGRDVVKKLVDEYGARAIQAETQQGVDWKALSHAVRVGTQAVELLSTGRVTFPLPNAVHILAIKTGSLPYQVVSEEIEGLLEQVQVEAARSSLPPSPDEVWIEDFVTDVYAREVRDSLQKLSS